MLARLFKQPSNKPHGWEIIQADELLRLTTKRLRENVAIGPKNSSGMRTREIQSRNIPNTSI